MTNCYLLSEGFMTVEFCRCIECRYKEVFCKSRVARKSFSKFPSNQPFIAHARSLSKAACLVFPWPTGYVSEQHIGSSETALACLNLCCSHTLYRSFPMALLIYLQHDTCKKRRLAATCASVHPFLKSLTFRNL